MLIFDLISWGGTVAILALFRYAWKHRKRKPKAIVRKPLPKLERVGKLRAGERKWQRGSNE